MEAPVGTVRTGGIAPAEGAGTPRLAPAERWAVAALVVLSACAYLPGLLAPLWIDDVLRTFSSHVALPERMQWLLGDAHNPLYNLFMLGWIHAFGDSEVSIRLPTVIAAYATGAVLFCWSRSRFGPAVAMVATWLFMLNPAQILHATMAKNNLFTVFFALVAMVAVDLLRREPKHRWTILAVAAGALALYTDWGTLVLLGPAWAMLAFSVRRTPPCAMRLDPKLVLLVVGLPLAAVLPLLLYKLDQTEAFTRPYLRHFDLVELWTLLFNWMLWGNALLPSPDDRLIITALGTALAAPLLVAGVGRLARGASGRLVLVALVAPLAALLVVSALIDARFADRGWYLYQPRNLLPLLAVLPVVLACGGLALRPAWLGRGLLGVLLAANAAGCVLIWTVHAHERVVYWPRRDFRAIARAVATVAEGSSEPVVIVCVPPAGPLRYYLRGASGVHIERVAQPPTGVRHINRFSARHGVGRLYLLVIDEEQEHWRLRRGRIAGQWDMEPLVRSTGLTLIALSPREGPAGGIEGNAPPSLPEEGE